MVIISKVTPVEKWHCDNITYSPQDTDSFHESLFWQIPSVGCLLLDRHVRSYVLTCSNHCYTVMELSFCHTYLKKSLTHLHFQVKKLYWFLNRCLWFLFIGFKSPFPSGGSGNI